MRWRLDADARHCVEIRSPRTGQAVILARRLKSEEAELLVERLRGLIVMALVEALE